MNVNDKIKSNFIKYLCENYIDVIATGLEEQSEHFVYTNSAIELLKNLKVNNISKEINNIFVDTFLGNIDIEITEYLAK